MDHTPSNSPETCSLRRSLRLNATPPSHDPLIVVSIEVRLKDTVNQRLASARNLGTHIVRGNDMNSVKTSIWSISASHLENTAVKEGDPPIWSVSEASPSIDMFDKYLSLRYKKKVISPCTESEMQRMMVKHRGDLFTLSIFKYGAEIATGDQLAEFQSMCIQPSEIDRSGAASEPLHQDVICRLKDRWGETLDGQEMTWRLWAGVILRRTSHQHTQEINKLPPSKFVRYFAPVSSQAQEQILRVQTSVDLASDVVSALLQNVAELRVKQEQYFDCFRMELTRIEDMLMTKTRMIESFRSDVAINSSDTQSVLALAAIPNMSDVDHN